MKQLTMVLVGFHLQKDQARKSKTRMKAIEEKHKLRDENEQIQKHIAKEENDD